MVIESEKCMFSGFRVLCVILGFLLRSCEVQWRLYNFVCVYIIRIFSMVTVVFNLWFRSRFQMKLTESIK